MAEATTAKSGTDTWSLIHEQRQKVGDMLATLNDQQWETASLCAGWRVRDVAAHNIETQLMTPGRFISQYLGTGFRFHAMNAKGVDAHRTQPVSDLLAQFRETAKRSTAPPGPLMTMLGEAVIHGEDMARPVGKRIDISPATLVEALNYARRTAPLLHGKQRSAGLKLRATDVDWSAGEGPEVSGPAASIILAICGRAVGLGDLTGDGVDTLRQRMS